MRAPCILFDLDGTIIDSIGLIIDSYRHTAATHGLPARSEAEWVRGLGTPLRSQFAGMVESPEQMDALIETYREYNLAHHDARVTAYPGTIEVIRALKRAGHQLGLVTSKLRHGAMRDLTLVGLEDAFDVLVCCDEVVNPKPHPEPVIKAMALLGTEPEQTFFVGDSPHDINAGRGAGVRTVAVLWGPFTRDELKPSEPDYWLERPAQLLELVSGPTPAASSPAPPPPG